MVPPPVVDARIGVLVVAYNAATTLADVLDRLPRSFRQRVDHVLVCDDASADDTFEQGLAYQEGADIPLTVERHPVNLGYGGNQKHGYRWAIERGLDIVVLLHGDGQYAPEVIEDLIAPLEAGDADAVFGSRMLTKHAARAGGMPLYKFVGNRILTGVENRLAGLDLTEWHSGYRAYRVDALADVPFGRNSDGFDFDTEIILQLREAGKRIVEVPIPTYYGDEICHVNGMAYAKDVVVDATRYRLHKLGFGSGELAFNSEAYEIKADAGSSHRVLLGWLGAHPPGRVLDIGCSDGSFGAAARNLGHRVVGVDVAKHDGVMDRVDEFVETDLDAGLPDEVGDGFDVVVLADVLEHVTDPERLLKQAADRVRPGGRLLISVPNFAHWYPRARVVVGRFDYDRRGILDRGHVRFFTRRSLERLLARTGLRIVHRGVTGVPLEVADRGAAPAGARTPSRPRSLRAAVAAADRLGTRAWPTMFGYQLVYEVRTQAAPASSRDTR
ncbi:MAG: methyltransferase domain-containing protein [Desertimonas sp.]